MLHYSVSLALNMFSLKFKEVLRNYRISPLCFYYAGISYILRNKIMLERIILLVHLKI